MTAWPSDEQRKAALVIGRALQVALRWPTPYFLPEDSLNAVVYGPRFRTVDDIGWDIALVAIENELGRQVSTDFSQTCAERDMSFGDFITRVVALPRQLTQPTKRWRLWP